MNNKIAFVKKLVEEFSSKNGLNNIQIWKLLDEMKIVFGFEVWSKFPWKCIQGIPKEGGVDRYMFTEQSCETVKSFFNSNMDQIA